MASPTNRNLAEPKLWLHEPVESLHKGGWENWRELKGGRRGGSHKSLSHVTSAPGLSWAGLAPAILSGQSLTEHGPSSPGTGKATPATSLPSCGFLTSS